MQWVMVRIASLAAEIRYNSLTRREEYLGNLLEVLLVGKMWRSSHC